MKAQTVREQLKGVIDPRLLKILEAMASDINALQHAIVQMGALVDRLATLMTVHTRVIGGLEDMEKLRAQAKEIDGKRTMEATIASEKADGDA